MFAILKNVDESKKKKKKSLFLNSGQVNAIKVIVSGNIFIFWYK